MRMISFALRVGAALAVVLLLSAGVARAQEATARIVGNITDPKEASIPGAKVTVTNVATQVSRETTTDRDGFFQVLSLPIGTYRVAVEHPGFRKATVDNQTIRINQVLRVDIQMELGSPTEVVEVSAQITGVETVNHTLGQSVTMASLVNLPLNGRNVYDLALLQPGVTETNPGSPGLFSIAGGRADSVTFLLDGGVNNNLLSNLVVFTPNPDVIAEFRILTSNYTAEYGRNGGGIVSAVTRSGTNAYHGNLFEFVRNDAFNANSFFNNRDGLPREVLKRNQFGFTIGGPITVPKVVKGKDRFFFFVGYQGQRQVQTITTSTISVFTPAELNGDFSLSNSTRTGPDSGVVAFLQSHPFFQPDVNLAAQGKIDPTKINSVAKKYTAANLIPTSAAGQLKKQGGSTNNRDELTGKFDINITSKDRLMITLGAARNPVLTPFTSTVTDAFGYSVSSKTNTYFSNIAYTRIFSPTLLNEFRFTSQRRNGLQAVPSKSLPKPADLGIGVTPDEPSGPTRLGFAQGLTIGFSPQGPTDLVDNLFVFSNTLSWTKGRNNWKFGASLSPYQDNTKFDFFVNGEFFFSGAPAQGGIGSGNDFADFLLGLPDEYLQFGAAPSDIRSKTFYAFAQNEWHVRKNLTLTLGIRYEYSQPKLDTKGRSFSLQLGQRTTVFPNAPIGLLFPGDRGAPIGANLSDKNDWAPRFGFAWDPWSNGKTSIRGGIGVFYDILKGEDNLQFNGQAPFFGFSDLFFDPLSGNPSAEVNYLTQPYVATGIPNPFPSKPPPKNIDFDASGFLPFGGGGVFFVDPHLRTPYTYHYNLSIQRELAKSLVFEASYVGSSSHKLTSLVDADPFNLGTSTRLFNATPGNDVFSSRAFSYLLEFRNVSTAHYDSLQLSLQKQLSEMRFLGRTYFTFAYTYGHGIDNASGFRQRGSNVPFYNPGRFRASTDFDVTHRITFNGGWDLPLDRRWSNRLTKGWSVHPIVTYRTGFPLDVFAGFSASGSSAGPSGAGDRDNVRAILVGNSVVIFDPRQPQTFRGRTGSFYFNPANFSNASNSSSVPCASSDPTKFPSTACAIANPALRTYGTLPRNFFRGPGRANVNFAIAKDTPLFGERVKLLFRVEFFNLFNHAQFDNPSTIITRGTFGRITTTADPRIIQLAAKFTF